MEREQKKRDDKKEDRKRWKFRRKEDVGERKIVETERVEKNGDGKGGVKRRRKVY